MFLRHAFRRPMVDMAGVEDAAFAALVAATYSGVDLEEACNIASHAAAVAGTQPGQPVVGWFEANQSLCEDTHAYKQLDGVDEARLWAEAARAGKPRKIAVVPGSFDVLHPGHTDLLEHGKGTADLVVVILKADMLVREEKGDRRPMLTADERLEMMSHLAQVDAICIASDKQEIEKYVMALKPNFLMTGIEKLGHKVPGADYVARNGGNVSFVPHNYQMSSTGLLEKAGATYES